MLRPVVRYFVILMLGMLAACASGPGPIGLASTVEAVDGEMPAPNAVDYTRPARSYYIGPSDRLSIDVFGVPELEREIQVDSAGRLSYPLIGVIETAGLTPEQLAREIEARLRSNFVKNPQVTVNLKETTNQLVTVDGQVGKPGMYPVTGRMTLERAVAVAGGASEFAKLSDVIIQREVGGKSYIGLYNLAAIRRGNYADPDVYPNDLIIVGESKQRRLFRDLLQVLPLATTPLVLLLQNN